MTDVDAEIEQLFARAKTEAASEPTRDDFARVQQKLTFRLASHNPSISVIAPTSVKRRPLWRASWLVPGALSLSFSVAAAYSLLEPHTERGASANDGRATTAARQLSRPTRTRSAANVGSQAPVTTPPTSAMAVPLDDGVASEAAGNSQLHPRTRRPGSASASALHAPVNAAPGADSTPTQPKTQLDATSDATTAPATQDDDVLSRELAIVVAAHRALNSGDGHRSLALLEKYDREFPNGSLQAEQRVTRVLALCRIGEVTRAETEARRVAELWPRLPAVARLSDPCRQRARGGRAHGRAKHEPK
jgi:hypothetical protein